MFLTGGSPLTQRGDFDFIVALVRCHLRFYFLRVSCATECAPIVEVAAWPFQKQRIWAGAGRFGR